ncbi:MAG TPA: hypothetical protein VF811_15435 [Parasulfuritortus sp.]
MRKNSMVKVILGTLLIAMIAIAVTTRIPRLTKPAEAASQNPAINPDSLDTGKLSSLWSVQVDQATGMPMLWKGGRNGLKEEYVFWGSNWAWTKLNTKLDILGPLHYQVSGDNKGLGFQLKGDIAKKADHSLVWNLDFDSPSGQSNIIGGGVVFHFDLTAFGKEMGAPDILPGKAGWTWGKPGGSHIEMRFDPPLPDMYFDGGSKTTLRAFLYKGSMPQGISHYTVTLHVSPDIAITPTNKERFGSTNTTGWYDNLVDWRTSPIDLSFLNADDKPAGKHGFVQAKGDELVFQDGTKARFWGTNLSAYTLFKTPHSNVKEQAKRLAALGFNLVRIHHFDSSWVSPNIFGDKNVADTQTINPDAIAQLDWWIKCLKDEGIYVWLDLQDLRGLKPGDNIDGFDEISKGRNSVSVKGYDYVNPSIQEAMKRFDDAYVNHVNQYTGVAYKDEPAIAAMLITNEDDLTQHFGNSLLPDKKVPFHDKIYMQAAKEFAKATGLPPDQTWRSWEPGPSKIFLNDLEHRFDTDMITYLRAQGVKCVIATTSTWGGDPLFSLPALTTGDLIDAHAYQGPNVLESNPLVSANLTDWIAAAQVVGKPVSVTEWNSDSFPMPDRHVLPLFVAAQASLQGWDALMQYAYSQEPIKGPGSPSVWHSYNDPSMLATMPAAALMYRQGDVKEATRAYVFAPDSKQLFYQALQPGNSPALRTAVEKGKLLIALPKTKELPWLKPAGIPRNATVFTDPNKPLIDIKSSQAISDTGELDHNWDKGTYTINTTKTQAAMGWIGGEKVALKDVTVAITTPNATVAVQSLDGKPIDSSGRLLISLGAQSIPHRDESKPPWVPPKFLAEPVEGHLSIRAAKGLRLYKLGSIATKQEIPAAYRNGKYEIDLDRSLDTYWLMLSKG